MRCMSKKISIGSNLIADSETGLWEELQNNCLIRK